jgi:hypothetical protein
MHGTLPGRPSREAHEPGNCHRSPASSDSDSIKDRCGIYNSKYGQAGVLIIEADGRRWGIRYQDDNGKLEAEAMRATPHTIGP